MTLSAELMRPPYIRNEFQRFVAFATGKTLKKFIEDDEDEFKRLLESFTAGFAAGFSLSTGMSQAEARGPAFVDAIKRAKDELKMEIEQVKIMARAKTYREMSNCGNVRPIRRDWAL